jgi:hypothetical protein
MHQTSARGTALAEQVKKQEASKRRVKDRLPKVTDNLRSQLAEWQLKEGIPVRKCGTQIPYLQVLEVCAGVCI